MAGLTTIHIPISNPMRATSILTLLACLGVSVVIAPRSASSMLAASAGPIAKSQRLSDGLVTKAHLRRWRERHRHYYSYGHRHYYYLPSFCSYPYNYHYWPFYYPICYPL